MNFTERVFRLPGEAALPIMIGALSGFPVGAVCTAALCREGVLSKDEGARILAASHNTGPAFPVAYVGAVMWSSRRFGWAVYISQIASGIIIAILMRKNSKRMPVPNEKSPQFRPHSEYRYGRGFYSLKQTPPVNSIKKADNRSNIISRVSDAVSEATAACVSIIGSIVFARVITDLITSLLPKGGKICTALIASVIEFSGGAAASAAVGGSVGAALTGFAVGFGGLCALLQAAGAAVPTGIPITRCFCTKLLQGLACAPLSAVAYILLRPNGSIAAVSQQITATHITFPEILTLIIFAAGITNMRRKSSDTVFL